MASSSQKNDSRLFNPNQLNITRGADDKRSDNASESKQMQLKESNITAEKVLKASFAIFLFLIVFTSGYIARIALHILLWQQHPPTIRINTDITTFGGIITFNCSTCHNASAHCAERAISRTIDFNWIWAMFTVIITPYVVTFLRTLFRIIFKQNKHLDCTDFIIVMFVESVNCIGVSLFTFVVLPSFDPVTASVVYLGTAVLPPLVDVLDQLFNEEENSTESSTWSSTVSLFIPIIGVVLQLVGIALLSFYSANLWLILSFIVSCLCISVRHWENFVTMHGKGFFRKTKQSLQKGKTKIECLVNLWKIILTFILVTCIYAGKATDTSEGVDALFGKGIATLRATFGGRQLGNDPTCWDYVPYLVALVKIICDYMYYKASKTVCVINCQKLGFSLPTFIIPVVTTFSLIGMLQYPDNFKLETVDLFLSDIYCWLGAKHLSDNFILLPVSFAVLYLSYWLIVRHVWQTHGYKHGETARIFLAPFYCGITIELSMLLNRRRHDKEYDVIKGQDEHTDIESRPRVKDPPMLFVCCATMWHETENEMLQLMKSIFRLDRKQFQNYMLTKEFKDGPEDVESFKMEAHVFFDDAFDPLKEGETFADVNEYVKTFTYVVNDAAKEIHGPNLEPLSFIPVKTPYGGRLEYVLPGENILVVHLKDKNKIRHKKRWSQVMYMFYILQHKLCLQYSVGTPAYHAAAENTFLLALDGDVDFKPDAVLSLARRMKKSKQVGAACGRIHPIGTGPMVWYQQFEYAISHWLQKATEHVVGCVLCSPGCFSLFRGSALLHSDVIKTYTKKASEATQYIQYDQGEDRWLCTLLLKEGWKVEYCAESDAYTFAPEGFYEFYNQRRRWSPSTMANILDLIMDWQNVTKKNQNISFMYVAYQMLLFSSTMLTPGTIFMMILGAIIVGFDSIPPWLALLLNILPVGLFLLMCLYASSQRQLQYAAVLSCIYAIVMAVVMIGVVRDAVNEGLCSMTTIFIIFVAGVFVIAALVHPMEVLCIMPGLLYFLAIPSMSMLMFLYTIGNLHVVSWGTRESKQQDNTKQKTSKHTPELEEKGYFCSLGKWIHCMLCPTNNYTKEDFLYEYMMNEIRKTKLDGSSENSQSKQPVTQPVETNNSEIEEHEENKDDDFDKTQDEDDDDDDYHIYFNETAGVISRNEKKFWNKILKKYLKPLEKDAKKEEEIEGDLVELRNKVCMFVYLLNAILITIMFGLTQVNNFKDSLTIKFPCGGKTATIVPIALLFTVVFGILLLVQFLCMLYHRFSTLVHITASTDLMESDKDSNIKKHKKAAEKLTKTSYSEEENEVYTDKQRSLLERSLSSMITSSRGKKRFKKLREVVAENTKQLNLDGTFSEFTKVENAAKIWHQKTRRKSQGATSRKTSQDKTNGDDKWAYKNSSNTNRVHPQTDESLPLQSARGETQG